MSMIAGPFSNSMNKLMTDTTASIPKDFAGKWELNPEWEKAHPNITGVKFMSTKHETITRGEIPDEKITAASPINSIIPAPGTFVVRMLKQSGVTTGGIHLPEQQSEAPNQAIVVYAGESTYNKGIEFMPKVGDRISMKRFGFSEVLVNGETLRQVGANDILGILL